MSQAVASCHRMYHKGWYATPGAMRATFQWFKTIAPDDINPMDALLSESGQDFRIEKKPVNGYVYELANACAYVDYKDVDIYTFYSKAELAVRSVYPMDCKWYAEPGVYVADLYPIVHVHCLRLWKDSLEAKYQGYTVVDYHHAVVPPVVWQRYRTIKEQYGEEYHVNVHFRPLAVWVKEHTKRCGVQWYVSGVYRTALGGMIAQLVLDVPESAPQHSLPEVVQLAQLVREEEEIVPTGNHQEYPMALIVPEEVHIEDSVPTTEVLPIQDSEEEEDEFGVMPMVDSEEEEDEFGVMPMVDSEEEEEEFGVMPADPLSPPTPSKCTESRHPKRE